MAVLNVRTRSEGAVSSQFETVGGILPRLFAPSKNLVLKLPFLSPAFFSSLPLQELKEPETMLFSHFRNFPPFALPPVPLLGSSMQTESRSTFTTGGRIS